jgi:hypothetical protein
VGMGVNFVNHFNTVNGWIIHRFLAFGLYLVRYWDRGALEALGPTGLLNLFHYYSFKLEIGFNGFIPHYILVTVLLFFFFFIFLTGAVSLCLCCGAFSLLIMLLCYGLLAS